MFLIIISRYNHVIGNFGQEQMIMNLNTLNYFIEEYTKKINGGGTFTYYELVDLFVESENKIDVNNLKDEAKFIKDSLHYEDWEIEKIIPNFFRKYHSRKSINRLATDILTKLVPNEY